MPRATQRQALDAIAEQDASSAAVVASRGLRGLALHRRLRLVRPDPPRRRPARAAVGARDFADILRDGLHLADACVADPNGYDVPYQAKTFGAYCNAVRGGRTLISTIGAAIARAQRPSPRPRASGLARASQGTGARALGGAQALCFRPGVLLQGRPQQ